MNIHDFKAIIFDWDGTLVDSAKLILNAHNHVREKMGFEPWTHEDIFGHSSKSARETYPEIFEDRSDEALAILYDYTDNADLKNLQVFEGSKPLLDSIKEYGVTMGVVSNKRHDPLMREITHIGWTHYFDVMVGAGLAERDKPNAAPLIFALDKLSFDVKPSEILYVGDSETDLLCAKNAGSPAALIGEGATFDRLVKKYNPQYVCGSQEHFQEMLFSGSENTKEFKAC